MADYVTSTALAGVPHAFSTRKPLPYEDIFSVPQPVLVKQVHGSQVVHATGPAQGAAPEADALVTDRSGIAIGIVTADCAPVLFADLEAGVIGAAHAGWRGAFMGVIENTVEAMTRLGARRDCIIAAIGPTIAQPSYEVDGAFVERFIGASSSNDRFFAAGRHGHAQFDLPRYVASRLCAAGVRKVDDLALDTYAEDARFHSFRRATHQGKPTDGRQTSVICLP